MMTRLDLTEAYRRADLACAKLHYRLHSTKMYERQPLIPTPENEQDFLARLAAARAQVEALETPEPVFSLLKSHFQDFLDGEALQAHNYFSRPAEAISEFSFRPEHFADIDSRPDAEKAEILLEQLAALPEIAARAEQMAKGSDDDARAALASECAYVQDNLRHYAEIAGRYFPALSEREAAAVSDALLRACAALEPLKARGKSAKAGADDESRRVPFTEEYYRSVLHDTLGVELDELLAWHRQEIRKARDEVFEIASRLPIAETPGTIREVSAALNRYAGPCDTPEEMFARMQGYLDRAQAAARDYVWYPEEVCRLEPTPYPLLASFPWGGYCDGDGVRRPITGMTFLNIPNYKALTDGWLKMQALHEAYPGHHIQYVRNVTDTLPETVKLGAKHIPLIEGAAHRTERVFEFVFAEDPFYPLFVAYRRLHTAVRIQSDLWLRYEGRPIADCVKLYMDELGFDHGTARGQVKAQESMEGYFTCYYYGMKKLADFEARYGQDAKSFTELLFSCGNIRIENVEAFLRLDDAQRRSYRQDFCSKLMDPQDVIRYRRD